MKKRHVQILVIAAMREEIQDFISGCSTTRPLFGCSTDSQTYPTERSPTETENFPYWETARFGNRVGFLVCGVGRKRARRTTMAALAWIEPREVIVPGYSGSMNPDVHPGDIILVQRVYHHAYSPETVRYVNSDLVAGITHAWEKAGLPVRMGAAVCVDQMLDSNATKQAIRYRLVEHGEKQVNCVDMESYYVLEVLEEFGIPTGIVRVITDYADETIGLDFSRIPRGKWRQRRYFFTHPKQWMVFRELVRTCNMARVHLTQYLDCYLSARIKINEVQTPAPPTFSDI